MTNHPNRNKRIVVMLSDAEARAALDAIGQMTQGNNNDFDEWKSQTHGSHAEWLALRRVEEKITEARRTSPALTAAQRDALLSCVTFVQAGEWPFDSMKPETLERAADFLGRM
jgi:hypothetical protein